MQDSKNISVRGSKISGLKHKLPVDLLIFHRQTTKSGAALSPDLMSFAIVTIPALRALFQPAIT